LTFQLILQSAKIMIPTEELIEIKKISAFFPPANSNHQGGISDGRRYRTVFGGNSLEQSYGMLRQFLLEEGYENLPLPNDADELKLFRQPAGKKAMKLFEEYGYVHYPIKIYFHPHLSKEHTLILYIYNQKESQSLLHFHDRLPLKSS